MGTESARRDMAMFLRKNKTPNQLMADQEEARRIAKAARSRIESFKKSGYTDAQARALYQKELQKEQDLDERFAL